MEPLSGQRPHGLRYQFLSPRPARRSWVSVNPACGFQPVLRRLCNRPERWFRCQCPAAMLPGRNDLKWRRDARSDWSSDLQGFASWARRVCQAQRHERKPRRGRDKPSNSQYPTGTIRMGRTPADSVVNSDLRLWALENCYVSTTAVFPTAGSANPGFTHLALTARLAEHLAQQIRHGGN